MPTRRIIYKGTGSTNTGSIVLPIDLDPTALTYITVIGGGGGGGKKNALSAAAGGGGGALSRGSFYLTPNSTIYYSVGAAGTGPTTNGSAIDGGAGGDTWVNISSNTAPTSNTQGVLAKGGGGGQGSSGSSGGAGGSSASGYGNVATYSGGNGGAGGTSNGSGGGGGGSAAVWNGNTSYSNGYNGGAGYNIFGDGGGGGGGGVLGAGTSATSITGGNGGLGYNSSSATANSTGAYSGGGGGGTGINGIGTANSGGAGGITTISINGVLDYWFSGGGGGGGGGSNNSSTTGGSGGTPSFGYASGGGGGGGGSGTTNSGGGGAGGPGLFVIEYTAVTSPITSSGTISMDTIQNFYGGSSPISMSEYYRSGSYVPSWAKGDSGLLPTTGQISFSDFKGSPYKQNLFITGSRDCNLGGKFSPSYEYFGFGSSTWYGGNGLGAIDVNTFSPKSGAVIHSVIYLKNGALGSDSFVFTLAGTLTNADWDSLYVVGADGTITQFSRTTAGFTQAGGYTRWAWTSVTTNPFKVDSSLIPSTYIEGLRTSVFVTV